MTRPIAGSGTSIPVLPTDTAQSEQVSAQTPAVITLPAATDAAPAASFDFPRQGWADPVALNSEIDATRQTLADTYRMQFVGQEGSSQMPPIQMRYGLPTDPVIPDQPPIAMRYGLPMPVDPAQPQPPTPPIAMRYGLPMPIDPAQPQPPTPPIAMRYGLPAPIDITDPAQPPEPPIAMRYGLAMPTDVAVPDDTK